MDRVVTGRKLVTGKSKAIYHVFKSEVYGTLETFVGESISGGSIRDKKPGFTEGQVVGGNK